jgi:hypothetical protein
LTARLRKNLYLVGIIGIVLATISSKTNAVSLSRKELECMIYTYIIYN